MVNKKGFIRTLEAVIAIILILGLVFYITPRVVEFEEKVPEDVANSKEFIMNQILYDKDYSRCVLNAIPNNLCEDSLEEECKNKIIENLIKKNIPYGYDWTCEICPGSISCTSLPPDSEGKSIYTSSIFVYTTESDYNTIRIYIWKK